MAVLRNKKGFTRKRDWVQMKKGKIIRGIIDYCSIILLGLILKASIHK